MGQKEYEQNKHEILIGFGCIMDEVFRKDLRYVHYREETLTPGRINMIEMPVRPTVDIMSIGHNINVHYTNNCV